jgi:PEP-CTERM motif
MEGRRNFIAIFDAVVNDAKQSVGTRRQWNCSLQSCFCNDAGARVNSRVRIKTKLRARTVLERFRSFMMKQVSERREIYLQRFVALLIGVLALTVTSTTALADPLHGFCWGGTTCSDNGTNTPTSANPPKFGFNASGKDATGDFVIDFLIPDNVAMKPASIGVTGSVAGTATLFNNTAWTSGQLDSYLGISASPANPIGAFGAGGISGYFVYQLNLGTQTLGGNSDPLTGPQETVTGGLPLDSYIVGFLDIPGDARWSATANSGAILETSPPPSAVPEPSSLLLFGTGIIGAATMLRRRLSS